jgi:hypothetical protein
VLSDTMTDLVTTFLQGSGVPCPGLFAQLSGAFNSILDMSKIDEHSFRPKIWAWATTGAPFTSTGDSNMDVCQKFAFSHDINVLSRSYSLATAMFSMPQMSFVLQQLSEARFHFALVSTMRGSPLLIYFSSLRRTMMGPPSLAHLLRLLITGCSPSVSLRLVPTLILKYPFSDFYVYSLIPCPLIYWYILS